MKLALVVRRVSEHGGTERVALGLARWLVARDHQVDLWCDGADVEVPGARLRPLGAGGRGRIWRLLSLARAASNVPADYDVRLSLVRAPGFDVLRAGGGCHRAAMARLGWSLGDVVEWRLDASATRGAGRVIANSRMAADQLVALYGLDPARVRVVHNGVDLRRFQPAPPPSGPPRLLFLGSGYRRKGLDTALRALARLPGLHLDVAGADPRPGRYQRLAARLGLGDRVRWLGPVPSPERLLPAAAALVLPTRYDPFANVTLEALAAGVPVATTLDNGGAEVLPEPWMAIADPEDDAALADVLERILQRGDLREASRAAAEAHPDTAAFAALEQVLLEPRC